MADTKIATKEEKMKALVEAKGFFAEKTKNLKEMQIISDTKSKELDYVKDLRSFMNAQWSWNLCGLMYAELMSIWNTLENITIDLMEEEIQKQDENQEIDIKAKVLTLEKTFKKHKPALLEFERIMKEGKKELSRFK